MSLENTEGKGEIVHDKHVFFTLFENSLPFNQIQNCRLQTLLVWKSLRFVVWETVNRVKLLTLSQTTNFKHFQTETVSRRQF